MEEKEKQTFSEWLKNYRKIRGWSIKFITDEMSIPYQAWQRWEAGNGLPAEYWQKLLKERLMKKGIIDEH